MIVGSILILAGLYYASCKERAYIDWARHKIFQLESGADFNVSTKNLKPKKSKVTKKRKPKITRKTEEVLELESAPEEV